LVLSACRLTSVDTVLIDYQRMGGDQTLGDQALYALEIAEQYAQHLANGGNPLRVAYVGQPHHVSADHPGL
jgi:hypothetical protein